MTTRSLVNCDCEEGFGSLPDGSIDLILTDPPYVKESWEAAYGLLAREGSRVLKPSGYLITYAGHNRLDHIMAFMTRMGLEWYWILCQKNQGNTSAVFSRNMICAWKPILIFQKPPIEPRNLMGLDMITCGKRSKRYHAWQQSIHEAIFILRHFARDGDLVLDPFAGSGTVLLAAKALGINYLGYEIDEKTHLDAVGRLEQTSLTLEAWV